jgi:predicted nucleotidyltransferase
MEKAQKIAEEILKFTDAKSIFLYGSRARADFYPDSDYEVGVLMEKNKYVSRDEIKKHFTIKGVSIFPFHYEDFITGNIDTPFQKSIYLREIIEAGKTLAGEEIIENLKLPEIKLLDILQDIRFNLGYALASTHSYRNGDNATASLHFAKACLFGTRDYIIFKTGKFLISYDDILQASKELDLQEYQDLPVYAFRLRKREIDIDDRKLFQNISYLNKFIEKQLLDIFRKEGDKILIKGGM